MRLSYLLILTVLLSLPSPVSRAAEDSRLAEYVCTGQPVRLEGVEEDASGIACREDTGLLYVVINGSTTILEMTPGGEIRRTIALKGFNDTEGITWMGGFKFAVVEERRRNLCIFDLADDSNTVAYGAAKKIPVDATPAENKGIEGVAWDAKGGRFVIVKEKQPRKLYEVKLDDRRKPTINTPWDIEQNAFGMRDLAGIAIHRPTGNLMILSDESACIVECTPEGEEVGRLSLAAGSAGLTEDVPQAEGIAFDASGRLYVCSEPNLVYVFELPR